MICITGAIICFLEAFVSPEESLTVIVAVIVLAVIPDLANTTGTAIADEVPDAVTDWSGYVFVSPAIVTETFATGVLEPLAP